MKNIKNRQITLKKTFQRIGLITFMIIATHNNLLLAQYGQSMGAQSSVYIYQPEKFTPSITLTTFLQGAFSSGLVRHKDVTATWAAVMNANALTQPYNVAPFSYTGTESVSPGFFTSTAATTDIMDWVLVEIRNAVTPATLITRKACFIREDGRIVALDGVSDPSFSTLATGNYHVVIRHRNHLAIRTATAIFWDASLCVPAPASRNFSTAQTEAYQNPAITTNAAQKNLTASVFGMWGGNANGMTTAGSPAVRASGPTPQNDYLYLIFTTLGGDVSNILSIVYHPADVNLDGQVRGSGPLVQNDYLFILTTILGGNVSTIINQHQ